MSCIMCLQVRERCPSLVRECHVLLPLLEEMEKHITAFYQTLERASRITSTARDPDTQTQTQQKQKWQVRYDDNEHPELEWVPGQSLKSIISMCSLECIFCLLCYHSQVTEIISAFCLPVFTITFFWNCWCTIRVFKYLNASLSTHLHISFCNFLRICWTSSKAVNVVCLWLRGITTPCRGRSPPVRCFETSTYSCCKREWLKYRAQHRLVLKIHVHAHIPEYHKSTALPTTLIILMRLQEHQSTQEATVQIILTHVSYYSFACCKKNNVITTQLPLTFVRPLRLCWRRLENGGGRKRPTTAWGGGLRNQDKSWREYWRKLRAAWRRLEMLRIYWKNTV